MSCAIAVMAKAPRAGFSKTRLVPPLSPQEAASLSAAFLRDITENLVAAAGREHTIAAYIAYAPAGLEALFDGLLAAGTGRVLADGSGPSTPGVTGFGACLLHALHALFDRGHASACVLNADSPTLPTAILSRAAALLAQPGDRAVLGPAEDGGYYLLGLKTAHARLFADIDWSTDRVAAQTRARAADIGLPVTVLPTWFDVDDAAALRRLRTEIGIVGYPAPFTAARLAQMVEPPA